MSLFTPVVISAAQAAQAQWGVPAATTLAQRILESSNGEYEPAGSFNSLGIQELTGLPYVDSESFEYRGGKRVNVVERFAKFTSDADCFAWHGKLIATSPVYRYAMACLVRGAIPTVAQTNAFTQDMAREYATAPNYYTSLLTLMRANNLYQYDVAWGAQASATPAQPVSSTPDVSTIQQKLNAAGAAPQLTVDGVMGEQTKEAISRFQAAHHLFVDGIAGPETLAALMTA